MSLQVNAPPKRARRSRASVLKTRVAVEASIQGVRAFVQLRGVLAAHRELAKRPDGLEAKSEAEVALRSNDGAGHAQWCAPNPERRSGLFPGAAGAQRWPP